MNLVRMLSLGIILGGIFGHLSLKAAVDSEVTVVGKVIGVDKKVVRIFNNGSISLAPRPKEIKVGQEVTLTYNLEDFKKSLAEK